MSYDQDDRRGDFEGFFRDDESEDIFESAEEEEEVEGDDFTQEGYSDDWEWMAPDDDESDDLEPEDFGFVDLGSFRCAKPLELDARRRNRFRSGAGAYRRSNAFSRDRTEDRSWRRQTRNRHQWEAGVQRRARILADRVRKLLAKDLVEEAAQLCADCREWKGVLAHTSHVELSPRFQAHWDRLQREYERELYQRALCGTPTSATALTPTPTGSPSSRRSLPVARV